MVRDIKNIERYLDDNKNSDIIYKKSKLMKMFKEDPDLLEVLGQLDPRPLNKYKNSDNPTKDELQKRKEILEYNERIKHDRIVPYLKLNGVQTEVVNYIAYDIRDVETLRYQDHMKDQQLWIMCMVHEDDMDTEYTTEDGMKIPRTDLLEYIIKDLLSWTNVFGQTLIPLSSVPDIVDMRYYVRTVKFQISTPNNVSTNGGNRYDKF